MMSDSKQDGMFDFFEEWLAGERFYVARCKSCRAKIYERKSRRLKTAVRRHRCGNDSEELEAVVV
ncbi:MAG: hypothetical protein QW540_09175 [Archaeoglobaceae archaeon]